MKTITIEEAKALTFRNEYHNERLKNAEIELQKINQFYPTTCEVVIDGEEDPYFEYTRFILKSEKCRIIILYWDYTKKYEIGLDVNLKWIDHYDFSSVRKDFEAPQKIGVLSTKKIEAWIKHEEAIFDALQSLSDARETSVNAFIEELSHHDVKWSNDHLSGEMLKNGISFKFQIHNTGYISKELKVHYSVATTIDNFVKLSENKFKQ